ncbi:uncharacterized protein K452DRAFT_41533 [Aplosporella prunicola CBS 121167]|uniref:Inositolphosphotransferase Aur1/Ipt1 domain-containing protein n=1 Tax=Aplosporella prunicola CBS 121167 TaxID=1176127 RepID=A0A6A6B9F0_9PEZI|nr:uncharacterized protein K452DRAFT_41533 [Aplosporella prunicola CBS 121167]KAF2140839.1 hypothetical protein K452DRAFT_41533 [Aplosporella prunicola CBS 121167]
MGAFKLVLEPGGIALAFTAGTLLNRRRGCFPREDDDPASRAPLLSTTVRSVSPSPSASPSPPPKGRCPDTARFRGNLSSRFLARFPFLIEIWYWNLTYWVYQLARALTATLIRDNDAVFALARAHALSLLALEQRMGIAIELPLQQYVLHHLPGLMPLLAKIYYSHILIGVLFLIYTYTYLAPPTYQRIRRTLALDNAIAFLVLSAWRCAPPRLLPKQYAFVDVLHSAHAGASWSQNKFQLTIAAMPSLHFGTSLFLAVCLVRFSPHRPLRLLAPLWPAAMLLTVLATANHFVLDAVVGAAIPAIGWRFNRVLLVLRPLEEWGFWVLRTEKPDPCRGWGDVRGGARGVGKGVGEGEAVKAAEWLV